MLSELVKFIYTDITVFTSHNRITYDADQLTDCLA